MGYGQQTMNRNYLAQAGTFSKSTQMWGFPDDVYALSGCGADVLLSDNKWYLDWVSGLGANLIGYFGNFFEYVRNCIVSGTSFSLVHDMEYRVAEKLAVMLQSHIPGWSGASIKVRFCKTGSEATTMAVRLARAVTNSDYVIAVKDMYHGWHDWTISRTAPAYGIPNSVKDNIYEIEWDAPESLQLGRFGNRAAAVVFEHPSMDVTHKDWYERLRDYANAHHALLIADEVVTGLRYGLGGACERFNIKPDLVCVGKALGNGFPIAAVVGPAEYMDWFNRVDPVFCSSTMWGETASLYAANYVLNHWQSKDVEYLWNIGTMLIDGLKNSGWDVFGHGCRSVMRFNDNIERAFFIRHMFDNGILMNRPNFPNKMHSENDIKRTCAVAREGRIKYESLLEKEDELKRYIDNRIPLTLFSNR